METGTVVQLYNILQFFTWLTCQCFMQGMVFLCLEADASSFY